MPEHHTNNPSSKRWEGWGHGLLGVIIFSGSLPATRAAVSGFTPLFLTASRAVIAAGLGAALLALLRQRRPARGDLGPLAVVALGVVVGFPLLTALALRHITSARSIVFIGLLPLATALFGLLRADDRPKPAFWLFSGAGSLLVVGFALAHGDGGDLTGDGLMLGAIGLCGLGYAEGARLSRRLGGWQVISWALLLAVPAMAGLALATWPETWPEIWAGIGLRAWIGLGYVSVFSMLVGFVFWYRGLALGGIAGVGQLQLLQPFLGLALAGLLLGEPVEGTMVAVAAGVVLCVVGAKRFA
ncbi:MAG TPA: DMT family transporter [Methylobacterium sp.]|jgi:drug/metabolite transporter (DMT)-like permease|uniref:DMT family transporter n=1 Tax=Methylorubrum sp. B1-46 TaxID=2897334 RepID=UPI001E41FDAE|nr:DMT family transporter [Methylorubrum sp. B1-46]UGB25444.1 DMT family transporter [Methylorubrum sp. B1-46]HEV2543282.1 DMT family transporter [Methylobacterium sp.]